MMDYNAISIPFGKIPDKTIIADFGICVKCFSYWTEKDGCSNPNCPEIIVRDTDGKIKKYEGLK
jgi:hypothetical protein